MKKILGTIVAMTALATVTDAGAQPADMYNSYSKNIPGDTVKEPGKFYAGLRFAYNMASFSNQYSLASNPSDTDEDSFSFVPQTGFDLSAGYQFAPKWRAELNYGDTGEFKDSDSGASFALSSQYLMANALYTAARWNMTSVYVGAGVGVAFVKVTDAGPVFSNDENESQTKTTIAGQLIAGLEQDLTHNFSVHLQYRLMYNGGQSHSRSVTDDVFVNDVSNILTNSFMVGARLKF